MKTFISPLFTKIFFLVFLLVSFFTLVGYITYGQPNTGIDDANITFVYAKNLAEGHGFVYNVGGEHVEGFSSMLWVLISSLAFKFFQSPEFVILLLNILVISLSASFFIIFLFKSIKSKSLAVLTAGIFIAWLFAVPNFIVWGTITLMEFGLYSSILLIIATILLKSASSMLGKSDKYLLSFMLIILVFIRPESLLWVPCILILFLLTRFWDTYNIKMAIRETLQPGLLSIISIILLISFRLVYFGYPFPNTYYAKVSSSLIDNFKNGIQYVVYFLDSNTFAFILVFLAFTFAIYLGLKSCKNIFRRSKNFDLAERSLFSLSVLIMAGTFIPIFNGGDHFTLFRFMQPIWPILIIPILILVNEIKIPLVIKSNIRPLLTLALITLLFVVFYNSNYIIWHKYKEQREQSLNSQFVIAELEQKAAIDFNSFFKMVEEKPTIGVLAAGGFKLRYDGDVNDLLGLNNVQMAHAEGLKLGIKNHASFNQDVFYKQLPDVISLRKVQNASFNLDSNLLEDIRFTNEVLKGLLDQENFKNLYQKAIVLNKETDMYAFGFYKRDFVKSLDSKIYTIFNQ